MRRSGSWTVGLLILAARALPSQAIGQGFELERAGQYEQAAAMYLAALRADPTNLPALLGLERVLPPLNRLGELLPAAQRIRDRAGGAEPALGRLGGRRARMGRGAAGRAGAAAERGERARR